MAVDYDFVNYQFYTFKNIEYQIKDLLARCGIPETIEPILANTLQILEDIAKIRRTELRLNDSSDEMMNQIARFVISALIAFFIISLALIQYLTARFYRENPHFRRI